MANTKNETPPLVPAAQKKLIIEKTPQKWIKQRRGPGGQMLDYVETGFVIQKLNEIFNYNWSFKTSGEKIGRKQIYLKGTLIGQFLDRQGGWVEIQKEQYGGADIKFLRGTQETVSIADDLKAAASDALKKCASLFGIASDVYWKAGAEYSESDTATVDDSGEISSTQREKIFAVLSEKGRTKLDLDSYIDKRFNKMSIQQLTYDEADALIQKLESLPEKGDDFDEEDLDKIDKALSVKF